MSEIVPGEPYSFTEPSIYYQHYLSSSASVSFKKGGWDCFRHLEILSQDSLLVMPDARRIPLLTMVHYPKTHLRALSNYISGDTKFAPQEWPSLEHLRRHLASESMALYLMDMARITQGRGLFVDPLLPKRADYLSLLTLIGLKQILGDKLDVLFPVQYIYQSSAMDLSRMHGLGFGCSYLLPDEMKSESELDINSKSFSGKKPFQVPLGYDYVIVGEVNQNPVLTRIIDDLPDKTLKIFLRGGDLPPTNRELKTLNKLSGPVFSRELC